MSIVTKPHVSRASEPSRDDDPTGVHALLSSLPHPDPMPEHLVERINASLAAEQTQRAARMENDPVSPMVTRRAHRPTRLVFAVAGAAAAVVLVAVISSIGLSGSQTTSQTTATSIDAAIASTSSSEGNADEAAPQADAPQPAGSQLGSKSRPDSKASSGAASRSGLSPGEALDGAGASKGVSAPQIRQSGTRYTQADFLAQAVSLHQSALTRALLQSAGNVGPASTTDWLRECMSAIGASEIQLVGADIAFYEGRPAVVIVGMANGAPLAYVVAPQCSHAHPAILRPATSLS